MTILSVDASWSFCRSYVMSPPVCMSRILIISYMFKNAQMHEASPVTDLEKKRVRMRTQGLVAIFLLLVIFHIMYDYT